MDMGGMKEQHGVALPALKAARHFRRARPLFRAPSRQPALRPRPVPAVGLVLLVVGVIACGRPTPDARCAALVSLRSAVRSVERAEAAERVGDAAEVRRHVKDVAALVGRARSSLAGTALASTPHGRRLLEAGNYLEFIVEEFETSGAVDGTLAQFASRELNRTVPGERLLSC